MLGLSGSEFILICIIILFLFNKSDYRKIIKTIYSFKHRLTRYHEILEKEVISQLDDLNNFNSDLSKLHNEINNKIHSTPNLLHNNYIKGDDGKLYRSYSLDNMDNIDNTNNTGNTDNIENTDNIDNADSIESTDFTESDNIISQFLSSNISNSESSIKQSKNEIIINQSNSKHQSN